MEELLFFNKLSPNLLLYKNFQNLYLFTFTTTTIIVLLLLLLFRIFRPSNFRNSIIPAKGSEISWWSLVDLGEVKELTLNNTCFRLKPSPNHHTLIVVSYHVCVIRLHTTQCSPMSISMSISMSMSMQYNVECKEGNTKGRKINQFINSNQTTCHCFKTLIKVRLF